MKKLILFYFLFAVSLFGYSQTKGIDSLKEKLTNHKLNDTTKIDIITNLTAKYISIDLDSFNFYTNQAWKLSLKNNNHRLSRIYSDKAIVKIMVDTEMDSARYYLNKALLELDKKEDLATRGAVYSNFAMSYQNSDEFEKRIDYMLKGVDILKEDHSRLCISHYNLALTYSFANFEDLTIKHFKLALYSAEQSGNKMVEALTQRGLANYEIDDELYESAMARLKKGLLLCEELKSPKVCLEINIELARLYHKLGETNKSKQALLLAKKFALDYKDDYDIMSVIMRLADHELEDQNYSSSVRYFEEFYKIYEIRPEPQLGIDAFYDWALVEAKIGNHQKANTLLEKHIKIKDSIFSLDNRNALANANAKYESEKKDKTILENDLKLEKSQAKTKLMTILIVSLLLASILLWFIFQQRQKRIQQQLITIQKEQEVLTLESLIEGEEKERLRISQELHDGVNGDLSAIKFKLSSLLKMNNDVINEAVIMIDNSCKQVRAISHNLVPPSLKDFNLIEAVNSYCENMNSTHTPEISFQHIGDPIDLNKKVEVNIFRIIQELVTNAIKHAEAKTIDVQISNLTNTLLVTVEDNGKGYINKPRETNGIGMSNIKSRVEYLNANLDIVTNDKGTSNTIEIDLNKINDN